MATETVTNRLTVAGLRDLLSRARAAIVHDPIVAKLHLKTIQDIDGALTLCADTIEASHMGCAADEPLLEWVADDAFNVASGPEPCDQDGCGLALGHRGDCLPLERLRLTRFGVQEDINDYSIVAVRRGIAPYQVAGCIERKEVADVIAEALNKWAGSR